MCSGVGIHGRLVGGPAAQVAGWLSGPGIMRGNCRTWHIMGLQFVFCVRLLEGMVKSLAIFSSLSGSWCGLSGSSSSSKIVKGILFVCDVNGQAVTFVCWLEKLPQMM